MLIYALGNSKNSVHQDKLHEELDKHVTGKSVSYKQLSKLRYLDACLREALRMFPSVDFVLKKNDNIPKSLVQFRISDIHKDPTQWEDPEVFEPNRFLKAKKSKPGAWDYKELENKWVPFSAGYRDCVAKQLAMMHMRIIAVHFFKRFEVESVGDYDDLIYVDGLIATVAKRGGLKVKISQRK